MDAENFAMFASQIKQHEEYDAIAQAFDAIIGMETFLPKEVVLVLYYGCD